MTHERKSLRAPVSLSPRYRSASSFELVEGQCVDLSDGGMFIAAEMPCDNGTLIKFECQLEGSTEMLRGVGRVVWRRTSGDAAHPSGMGLKFVKLEDGCKELIAKVVKDAEQRGSTAPEQPLPAAVRQTDSFRPSQEPPAATRSDAPKAAEAETPAASSAAVAKVPETVAEAAAPAPVDPAKSAAKPAASTPSKPPPSAATNAAPAAHPPAATPAAETGSGMPIMLALGVGAVLLLWLLLR